MPCCPFCSVGPLHYLQYFQTLWIIHSFSCSLPTHFHPFLFCTAESCFFCIIAYRVYLQTFLFSPLNVSVYLPACDIASTYSSSKSLNEHCWQFRLVQVWVQTPFKPQDKCKFIDGTNYEKVCCIFNLWFQKKDLSMHTCHSILKIVMIKLMKIYSERIFSHSLMDSFRCCFFRQLWFLLSPSWETGKIRGDWFSMELQGSSDSGNANLKNVFAFLIFRLSGADLKHSKWNTQDIWLYDHVCLCLCAENWVHCSYVEILPSF